MICKSTDFNWRLEAGNEMKPPSLLTLAWLWAELTTGITVPKREEVETKETETKDGNSHLRDTKRYKREMSGQNRKSERETETDR